MNLQAFPVQYPAGHWSIDRAKQFLNGPRWSLEIFFCNSFNYPSAGGTAVHKAIDIMGAVGLPVVSTTAGRVAPYYFVGSPPSQMLDPSRIRDGTTRFFGSDTLPGAGQIVVVVDDFGFLHYYAHLDSRTVLPGRRVAAGEMIGTLGKTGSQSGNIAHLHYQVIGPPCADDGPYGVPVPYLRTPVSTGERPKRVVNQYQQLVALAKGLNAIAGRRRATDDVIFLIPFDQPYRTVSGFSREDLVARRPQVLNPA